MVQLARRNRFAHLDQAGQRDHRLAAAAHKNLFNIVGRVAARRCGLHNHVKLVAVALVAGDLSAAQHGFNGSGHHIHTHTQVCSFLAVYVNFEFGFVESQVNVGGQNARIFGNLIHELAGDSAQVLIAVGGHDHKINRPLAKALAQRWRRDGKGRDARQAAQLGLQFACHVKRGSFAQVPVNRSQKHVSLRHGRVAR